MTADPFEPAGRSKYCRRRIRWLVAAHSAAMAGALASKYVWPVSYIDVAGNLEFAQVMLLFI